MGLTWFQAGSLGGAVVAGIMSLMQTTFNADLAMELYMNGLLKPPISNLVATTLSAFIGTIMVGTLVVVRWMMTRCGVLVCCYCPAAAASDKKQTMLDPLFLDEKSKAQSPCWAVCIAALTYAIASVCGAAHITLKMVTSPVLGLGLDYMYAIIGQLLASLTIDSFGLLGVARAPPKPARFLAVALTFIGAAIIDLRSTTDSTFAESDAASTNTSQTASGVFLTIPAASSLSLLAGVLHPIQAAVMLKILQRHPDPFVTALISFVGSSSMLLAISLICYSAADRDTALSHADAAYASVSTLNVYDYLGGLGGGSFVVLTVLLTPRIGLSAFFIGLVIGEVGTSLMRHTPRMRREAPPWPRIRHRLPLPSRR